MQARGFKLLGALSLMAGVVLIGPTMMGVALAAPNPGSLDITFGGDGTISTPILGNDWVYSIAVQADGKLIVAGDAEGQFALARYNTNGALDTTFDGEGMLTTAVGSGGVRAVALQADGKIVAAGMAGSPSDFALARYNSGGSLDPSFGSGGIAKTSVTSGWDYISSIAIQSDGKIVAVGFFNNGYVVDSVVARYMPDGTLDPTFGSSGIVTTPMGVTDDAASDVAIQPDGKIVVAGYACGGSNWPNCDLAAARYTAGGILDLTFGSGGIVTTPIGSTFDGGNSLALQPDGKVVVAGYSWTGYQVADSALVRYNADGSLDTGFDGDGKVTTATGGSANDSFDSVALQANGKIVAAGTASTGSNTDFALVRYNADGSQDTSFDADGVVVTAVGTGNDDARAMAIQPNGMIVAAGATCDPSWPACDFAVARYVGDPVVIYDWSGFFAPVDNPGTDTTPLYNVMKAGAAVPVKFSLGGNRGLDVIENVTRDQVACDAFSTVDGVEQTVSAGGSSLSYEAATDTYTYVWKTDRAWSSSTSRCRMLDVELRDGTHHVAYFKFTK